MKKITFILLAVFCSFGFQTFMQGQTPFNRGVNLTGWFQTSNPRQIQFSKYTKKDFENIKSLGCDAIRLPINLFSMTSGSPDYRLDPLFFEFLDQAVNWAEDLQLYLIIDNHTSDDLASKNPNLEAVLINVWTQMATRYQDRSDHLIFEILNEPNGITTQNWSLIQQKAIDAIREVDTKHFIIVGASGYNTYSEMSSLPVYADSKLIYTFHFYDPFVFTHQGATWPTPSMASLANVPFPYNASTMPSVPSDLVGTWVASAMNNYKNEGTLAKVKSLIDIAVDFKTSRNVNIYCGEFGVYIPNSKDVDRVYWYSEVRKYLEAKGIAWTIWDYQGGFGLFKKGTNEIFDYDLNIPLVTALGLNQPAQQTYVLKPDSVGFSIYSDFIAEKINEASNASGGTVDFYAPDKPNNGKRCLFWNGCSQYGTVGFNFIPDKDLSELRSENYALSFIVRGNSSGAKFDLRFTDTKTGSADHPWRMNYTMTETKALWDGKWHKVYIPLTSFTEGGSWDDGSWYNPAGLFDWEAVDRFEIVAEQAALTGKSFWFDNIQVVNMDTAQIYETTVFTDILPVQITNAALTAYPNPAGHITTISYTTDSYENVDISIYNLSGQKIKTIVNARQNAGKHSINWERDLDSGKQFPKGIYVCRLQAGNQMFETKLILL
ncbi:MAG: cellulase family glycosylhydrolase [Bacteroidales bacterium]|nr:cellulase family glycosylhydrolase [Bacteroidales bacterium]